MHISFSLEHLLSALKLSATSAFTVLCGGCHGEGRPVLVLGKVCKGFRLAVFVWFTLLFSLFFCCCSCCCSCYFFSFGFEMNVSIHFTLHCVPSGARHAKRTAGLGSQSHPHPHSRSRSRSQSDSDSSRECLEAKSASVAEQGLPLTARHHYNLLICFVKHQTTKASTKNKEKKKEITTRKRNESETARERIKLK